MGVRTIAGSLFAKLPSSTATTQRQHPYALDSSIRDHQKSAHQ